MSETTTALAVPEPIQRMQEAVDAWRDSDDVAVLEARVEDMLESTSVINKIVSGQAYEISVDQWKALGTLRREVNEHYDVVKKPAYELHRKVSGDCTALVDRIKTEEDRLNTLNTDYYTVQDFKRRADEERMQREQAATEKARRDGEASEAEAAGASPAEVEVVRTAPSTAPPVALSREQYTPPTGTARKPQWKSAITDMIAFLDALCVDHADNNPRPPRCPLPEAVMGLRLDAKGSVTNTYLNNQARDTKGKFEFPGVRVYDDGKLGRTRGK